MTHRYIIISFRRMRNFRTFWVRGQLCLLALFLLLPQAVRAGTTFSLKSDALVTHHRVFLSDVSECQGLIGVCEQIYAVDVGASPKPGQSLNFKSDHIDKIIGQEFRDTQYSINGASSVKVTADFVEVTKEMLEDAINSELEGENSRFDSKRILLIGIRMMRGIRVYPGDFEISLHGLEGALNHDDDWVIKNFGGTSSKEVVIHNLRNSTKQVESVNMVFSFEKKIPVAARSLKAGDLISPQHIEHKWVRLRDGRNRWAASDELVVGKQVRRIIGVGKPFSVDSISRPLVVSKGQEVNLVAQSEGFKIVSRARAMEDGAVGDVITVQNLKTTKNIAAKVTGVKKVEVMF